MEDIPIANQSISQQGTRILQVCSLLFCISN